MQIDGTHAADVEEQALELLVLGARDLEETSGRVLLRARRLLVLVESVRGEEEEGGAGVEDGGVSGTLLLLPAKRPRQRVDLPEALGAI